MDVLYYQVVSLLQKYCSIDFVVHVHEVVEYKYPPYEATVLPVLDTVEDIFL
jgi:hypothetical protein